jgi:eukaryotic-like serine/threonine-protein kinase
VSLEVPGYTVLERVGTGARSSIWQVSDVRTGEVYVLKRVTRRLTDDDRYLEQAQTEFSISVRFDHPNLRRSFEIRRLRRLFQVRELHLLMEYVPGKTLEQLGPKGVHGTLAIFAKVAEGLDALHQLGYVHADMKPNNIIVGDNGEVKIIDFGQSCPIGHVKERIQGTPDYIAPEQVRRLPLDQRTDVFNFGATLYWILTGKAYPTILPSKKRRGGIDLVTSREALPPHEVNENVPLALSRLVMDCCENNVKDRPANMREVIRRLEVVQHIMERSNVTVSGGPPRGKKRKGGPASPVFWSDTCA